MLASFEHSICKKVSRVCSNICIVLKSRSIEMHHVSPLHLTSIYNLFAGFLPVKTYIVYNGWKGHPCNPVSHL